MSQIIEAPQHIAPALPSDLLSLVTQEANKATANIASAGFNVLRAKRSLELWIDGQKQEYQYGKFIAVLLTSSEYNHAVWYKGSYQAGSQDAPDLVWIMKEPGQYPDALPERSRQKIGTGASAHWDYQIRRRTVWAQVTQKGIHTDTPFVLDIPSSLLYGKSQVQGSYTWKDLLALCNQESKNGYPVYPGMFFTRFVAHSSSTLGLFYFQPVCTQEGYIQYLNADLIRTVLTAAQDPDVKRLAVVQEKLTYDGAPNIASNGVPNPAPAPVQAPAAAPNPAPAAAPAQPAQAPNPAAAQSGTAGMVNTAAEVLNKIAAQNAAANQGTANTNVSSAADDYFNGLLNS